MKPTSTKADIDRFEYFNPDYHNFLRTYTKSGSLRNVFDKKPLTFKDFKRNKFNRMNNDIYTTEEEDSQSNYHEKLYYDYHTVEENNFTGKFLDLFFYFHILIKKIFYGLSTFNKN